MRARAVLAVVALAVLGGCSGELSVGLSLRSDPPIEPDLGRGGATIAEGTAVAVAAVGLEDDDVVDDAVVDLVSDDPGIVDVRRSVEPNEYVLVGRRAGTTAVRARVDGEAARSIEVTIAPQDVR